LDEHLNAVIYNTGMPPPDNEVNVTGTDNDSETLLAWEMGYRQQFGDALTLDVSGFYNQYNGLIVYDAEGLDYFVRDAARADSFGLESAVRWCPANNVRIAASHSILFIDAQGTGAATFEDKAPDHQVKLRGDYDLTNSLALNSAMYYVGSSGAGIPEYYRLDVGLAWRINGRTELSVWGQNLLDSHHPEFVAEEVITTASEVDRGVYVQLRCRF
jgi:iron complex outermembrane receptor protein